ncbi:MAG: FtsB family cell division protein [Actinomycetota bacterium]|nr:septum formation initiator family protein [Actinomycetota bacterium]
MRAAADSGRTHLGFGPQAVVLLLILLILCLAGAMLIEPTRQLLEQRQRIAGVTQDLRQLRSSNKHLDKRIERLNDPDYLEQQAREQIGLVRPGEVTYRVMPPARTERQGLVRKKAAVPAEEQPQSWLERLASFIGF